MTSSCEKKDDSNEDSGNAGEVVSASNSESPTVGSVLYNGLALDGTLMVEPGTFTITVSNPNNYTHCLKTDSSATIDESCWVEGESVSIELLAEGNVNRTLYLFARNPDGNYSSPTEINIFMFYPTDLAKGKNSVCFLFTDSRVFCLGRNDFGQLGRGTTSASEQDLAVVKIDADTNLSNVTKLFSGKYFKCAIRDDKTVWCWGENTNSEVGDGGTTNREYATQVLVDAVNPLTSIETMFMGHGHSCAIDQNDEVWCWGKNNLDQTCTGSALTSVPYAEKSVLSTDVDIVVEDLAFGATNVRNLYKQGSQIFSCGNGNGIVTTDKATDTTYTGVGTITDFAGSFGSGWCYLNDAGDVYCANNTNTDGAVGNELTTASATPTKIIGHDGQFVSLVDSAQAKAICGLTNSNELKCWGTNSGGMFGIEQANNVIGDDVNEMTNLEAAKLGSGTPEKVVIGRVSTCVLFTNKRVKCFGANTYQQLGYEDVALMIGDVAGELGDNLEFESFADLINN